MADSAGMDRRTGRMLYDWAHVIQSICDILSTPFLTRVMRRLYGSDVAGLIDRPMTDETLLAFYVAVGEALRVYEPRFELQRVSLSAAGRDGRVELVLTGIYRPRAHRGDFTPANDNDRSVRLVREGQGWAVAA